MYTHWACFECRKSFAKTESRTARKCPECAREMTDMGPYFEPPRRLNKRRWEVMRVLADAGLRFNTKDSQIYIQNRILQAKNPRVADVLERIEEERRKKLDESTDEQKTDDFDICR
jgi:hypothetical protein